MLKKSPVPLDENWDSICILNNFKFIIHQGIKVQNDFKHEIGCVVSLAAHQTFLRPSRIFRALAYGHMLCNVEPKFYYYMDKWAGRPKNKNVVQTGEIV